MKVFLDCMIYLHYRYIVEIDLLSLLNTEKITIVIPRITLHELDIHKNTNQSKKVRDRARSILKKIENWTSGEASLRQGISFEFFNVVPTTNYEKHGLNPHWNDDILIATILEYSRTYSGEQIVLITQDSGPLLTAIQLGITVKKLPEKMKLPEELDPLEVENRKLTKTLEKLQNALPQLTVCFAGSKDPESYRRFSIHLPMDKMDDEIAGKIDDLRSKLPKQYRPKASPQALQDSLTAQYLSMMNSLDPIMPKEYERYNRDVDAYLSAYEKYMRETWAFESALLRTINFQIEIRNTGSAPAEDVDVHIQFPDGFILMTKDSLPYPPKEPHPPRAPRTRMQIALDESIDHIPNFTIPSTSIADLEIPTSFNIERTGSYTVTDNFMRIKHGSSVELPEMYLTFDSFESANSFNCEYTIRPENLPEPLKGKLHFVIEKNRKETVKKKQ